MGYDINRFQGEVDEELICPICSGVLEEPLQVRALSFIFVEQGGGCSRSLGLFTSILLSMARARTP